MILTVGAVEIPVGQALEEDREEAIAAIDKELKAMHVIRKRLTPIDEAKLTPMQHWSADSLSQGRELLLSSLPKESRRGP